MNTKLGWKGPEVSNWHLGEYMVEVLLVEHEPGPPPASWAWRASKMDGHGTCERGSMADMGVPRLWPHDYYVKRWVF